MLSSHVLFMRLRQTGGETKKGMHCHNSLQADAVGNTHEETGSAVVVHWQYMGS